MIVTGVSAELRLCLIFKGVNVAEWNAAAAFAPR
jgi:hypothetical protein